MLSLVTLEDKLLRIWGVALVGNPTTITSSNNRSDGPRSPRCDSIPVTNGTRNDQLARLFYLPAAPHFQSHAPRCRNSCRRDRSRGSRHRDGHWGVAWATCSD